VIVASEDADAVGGGDGAAVAVAARTIWQRNMPSRQKIRSMQFVEILITLVSVLALTSQVMLEIWQLHLSHKRSLEFASFPFLSRSLPVLI
jgi:hypothetical protein